MPSFLKNPALWMLLAACGVFAVSARLFSPDELSDATATMLALTCGLGLWRWGPTGWRVFWKGAKRTEDWGVLGLCFVLISIIVGRVYGIVYRQMERPDWLTESYWSPFSLYMLLCAVVLLVAATKYEREGNGINDAKSLAFGIMAAIGIVAVAVLSKITALWAFIMKLFL